MNLWIMASLPAFSIVILQVNCSSITANCFYFIMFVVQHMSFIYILIIISIYRKAISLLFVFLLADISAERITYIFALTEKWEKFSST